MDSVPKKKEQKPSSHRFSSYESGQVSEIVGKAAVLAPHLLGIVINKLTGMYNQGTPSKLSTPKQESSSAVGKPAASEPPVAKVRLWDNPLVESLPSAMALRENTTKTFRASSEGMFALATLNSAFALIKRAEAAKVELFLFNKKWNELYQSEDTPNFARIINSKYEGDDPMNLDELKDILMPDISFAASSSSTKGVPTQDKALKSASKEKKRKGGKETPNKGESKKSKVTSPISEVD